MINIPKKEKRPLIYDTFFNMFSDDQTSQMAAKVWISVVFIEMYISNIIAVSCSHQYYAYDTKQEVTLVSFFYAMFEFFDLRLNKDNNNLLYYSIFIILLRRAC